MTSSLNLAAYNNSPDRSTKSTTSHLNVLCVLVNIRFQVLFHSPSGVLFTFPSQYCSTIGYRVVFRLGGWSPLLPSGFHVSARTPDTAARVNVSHTRLSLSLVELPISFRYAFASLTQSITPVILLCPVWPLSLSLAATREISVDLFSSAYLDVSVRRVPFLYLWIQ